MKSKANHSDSIAGTPNRVHQKVKQEPLIIRPDMTVDSRVIASGCGVEHKAAIQLLETHKLEIESELGLIPFQMEAVKRQGERGTKHQRFALLTEDQATALITMFRNTPVAIRFKVALAKAFGEAKRGRLPTPGDLARMVLDYERQMGIADDIFDKVLPSNPYGSIAPNGKPRTGIRRAAFVALAHRMHDAGLLMAQAAQLELSLLTETFNQSAGP